MASGTINGTTTMINGAVKVDWSESSASAADNTSVVTAIFYARKTVTNDSTYGSFAGTITIDGTGTSIASYVTINTTNWVEVGRASKTVAHASDGSKSITISVTGGISGTTWTSTTLSGTATLSTIARQSSISLAAGNFGSAVTATVSRNNSAYTHTLVFSMGSGRSTTVKNVGTSYSFTVPASWAAACPSSTSATLSVSCTTYNGSTQIGSTTSATSTISIPSSWKPTVSISKTLTNGGDNGQVLQGITTVNLTASGTATTGASVSSYTWSGGAVSGTGATKTHSPTTSATFTYTVTVKDSRGKEASATLKVTSESPISSISSHTTSVNFGASHTVNITRKKSSFTHTVRRQISSSYTNDQTNVGTSNSYTIPTSWAASVPKANSIKMTVTVYTYNGTTLLGSVSSTATVNVPSSWVPSIGNPTATAVSGFGSLYLKSVSKVTIAVASGTASTGATISSYTFSGNNLSGTTTTSSASASKTSDILTTTGTNTYTVKITDSRGKTASKTVSITVTNYAAPSIRMSVGRYTSAGASDNFGDYGRMTASGSYSAVTGNKWTLTLKYRIFGSTSGYTTSNTYSDQTGTVSKTGSLFKAPVENAYECVATITDAVGKSASVTIVLSTGKAITDYYKDKVVGMFGTASENLLTSEGSPDTILYSGAEKNIFENGVEVGRSTQSILPTSGIKVHDVRNITIPTNVISKGVNFFFSNKGMPTTGWWAVIHIKGWTDDDYNAFEFALPAGTGNQSSSLFYVRSSNGTTWGAWRKIYESGNTTISEALTSTHTGYGFRVMHETEGKDAYFRAERSDSGKWVSMGIGAGGVNHGVYSGVLNKWLVYGTDTDVILNGNAQNVTGTVAIAHGGTGATSAANAKENLGLGTAAQNFRVNLLTASGQFFGLTATNLNAEGNSAPYNQHRVMLSTTYNGVFLYDSTDAKTIWNLNVLGTNAKNSGKQVKTGTTSCANDTETTLASYSFTDTGHWLCILDYYWTAGFTQADMAYIEFNGVKRIVRGTGTNGGGNCISGMFDNTGTVTVKIVAIQTSGSAKTCNWRFTYIKQTN